MMRALAALLLASFVVGCTQKPAPQPTSAQPAAASPTQGPEQRHVMLPPRDVTKELREHCGKASADLAAVEASVRAKLELSAGELTALQQQLAALREQMDRCLTMVHGMEEVHLGTEAEKNR